MIFNAPFICAYLLLYYFLTHVREATLLSILGIIFFLYIIPWAPVVAFSIVKRVDPNKLGARERNPFVIIGLISYFSGAVFFYYLPRTTTHIFLFSLHLMYGVFSLLLIIGNKFSKPSIHTGGFVAPIILASLYTTPYILILLALTPIVAWSRIKLRIHTINQLVLGFLIGLLSVAITHVAMVMLIFPKVLIQSQQQFMYYVS